MPSVFLLREKKVKKVAGFLPMSCHGAAGEKRNAVLHDASPFVPAAALCSSGKTGYTPDTLEKYSNWIELQCNPI